MSKIITPALSPYTVDLTGSENLQTSNILIQTSGGAVNIVLPVTNEVGSPKVTVVCLDHSASITLASGAIAVPNGAIGQSGFVTSGTIATLNAGSFFSVSATPAYWLV